MREVHLLDSGGKIADMQDPRSARAHQERRLLHRIVADRDDQIGPLDRIVDIVALRQRGGSHVEPGSAGDGALAHLRIEERDLQALHEIRQGVRQARAARARAKHHQGALGIEDQSGRSVQRRGRGDRLRDRVGRHRRDLGRLLCRDVLRQFEMHRAWPLLLRDPKSLAHDRRDRRRADDLMRHLGQRCQRRNDVDDLKPRLLPAQNAFLASYHDHRHRAEQGVGGARRQIERARTQRRKANTSLARQPPQCGCHERRRLFVAGHHQFDRRATQGFDDVEIFFPRDPEDLLYTLALQCRYEQISPIHPITSLINPRMQTCRVG